jgi:hypothetical protein
MMSTRAVLVNYSSSEGEDETTPIAPFRSEHSHPTLEEDSLVIVANASSKRNLENMERSPQKKHRSNGPIQIKVDDLISDSPMSSNLMNNKLPATTSQLLGMLPAPMCITASKATGNSRDRLSSAPSPLASSPQMEEEIQEKPTVKIKAKKSKNSMFTYGKYCNVSTDVAVALIFTILFFFGIEPKLEIQVPDTSPTPTSAPAITATKPQYPIPIHAYHSGMYSTEKQRESTSADDLAKQFGINKKKVCFSLQSHRATKVQSLDINVSFYFLRVVGS